MIGEARAKAKDVANSAASAGRRRGRVGLALLVLTLAIGAGWVAFSLAGGPGAPRGAGAHDPAAPPPISTTAPTPDPARVAPVPLREPTGDEIPSGDLAPLASDRGPEGERFRGSRGRIRGSLEVVGKELGGPWELVLAPSLTLMGREHAEARTLELAAGVRDFDLRDLPLAGYDLCARAPGFNGYAQPILLERRQAQVFVTLLLEPAGFLEGTVVDEAGTPLPGVMFSLLPLTGAPPRLTESDVSGRYRFDSVPDGAYELVIGHHESPIVPRRRAIQFLAPSLTVPEIELPPLAGLDLLITDPEGNLLPGVMVRGSGNDGGRFEGVTGADGRLPVRYLPPGRYRVRSALEGYDEQRTPFQLEAGTVREARVVLYP